MNDKVIVTVYVVIDALMEELGHESHRQAVVSDAEILTVAVVAALYFRNHQERALQVMIGMGYLAKRISISRFNRRVHQLADWLDLGLVKLGELFARGEAFVLDSMPLPVCKRVRAWRCRKVRGVEYCGYCAAKKEKFFGWRLHLVCTPDGLPVAFEIIPGAFHDLTPIHELTVALPEGACVYTDKGYNAADDERSILMETGVRLVPIRKSNMTPHPWADEFDLRLYRRSIETRNSQLENMGVQHLHARTNAGFELKVHAALFGLACHNLCASN
jgi:hypothetical protein